MADDLTLSVLVEIRDWIRASSFKSIQSLLKEALPDVQSRLAYQMFDGVVSMEQVRVASKMSPNKLVALTQRWTSMGLMEITGEKKKKKLFDLSDFGLIGIKE
jgi:hypothetical protein